MSTAAIIQPEQDDRQYPDFLAHIRRRFETVAASATHLFETDADNLWPAFIAALPEADRQHHTCHACRHFVERFGGLVTIDEFGRTASAMWGADAPGIFGPAISDLARRVARAKVTGVHLSSDRVWGQPVTGAWHHMAVTPPAALVFRKSVLVTAGQAAAAKREEFGIVSRGLAEYNADVVGQALALLQSEALYRSEKCIGPARWLADLHAARNAAKGSDAKANVIWRAVAGAPVGFTHVRSSMISTLLDDIAAGLPIETVRRKFADKMRPDAYLRPQAPPKAGNIAEAEKIVAALRSTGALDRRFARLADVRPLWTPTAREAAAPEGGVFGHLKAKPASAGGVDLPAVTMTWEKFARTVLPGVVSMTLDVPRGAAGFGAMLTAANPGAPPILQWDAEDDRNTVSWYVYTGGSHASQWGLTAGARVKVSAVVPQPHMWAGDGKHAHQGRGLMLVLDGARESRNPGLGLFPEILRSEYHGIRATIEAFSRAGTASGREDGDVCGMICGSATWGHTLRAVLTDGSRGVYLIDRWD